MQRLRRPVPACQPSYGDNHRDNRLQAGSIVSLILLGGLAPRTHFCMYWVPMAGGLTAMVHLLSGR
jgi:hypothetical protein